MTTERYTAILTGALIGKKPGEYFYLTMSEDPDGSEGSSTLHRGRPPYERLGCEISFGGLPKSCQRLILDNYRRLWNL